MLLGREGLPPTLKLFELQQLDQKSAESELEINSAVRDPKRFVYHYTTFENETLDTILKSNTLRFGPFSTLNDPREAKDFRFTLYKTKAVLSEDEYLQAKDVMDGKASQFLKANAKILCMSCDDDVSDVVGDDLLFGSRYRGYGHPRMWSQYGGNHKGVYLIFDKEVLDTKISEQLASKGKIVKGHVEYGDLQFDEYEIAAFHLNVPLENATLEQIMIEKAKEYADVYFLKKHNDWAQEVEWRWILIGENADFELVNFGDALVGIVMGTDIVEDNFLKLVDFSQKTSVPVFTLDWYNGVALVHNVDGTVVFPDADGSQVELFLSRYAKAVQEF